VLADGRLRPALGRQLRQVFFADHTKGVAGGEQGFRLVSLLILAGVDALGEKLSSLPALLQGVKDGGRGCSRRSETRENGG
jgi:hypothetical protein